MARPLTDLTDPAPSRLRPLDLILVAMVTLAAFIPILRGQFSPVDDYTMLLAAPQLRAPTWAGYWQYWVRPAYRIYMPLTLTIWQAIAYVANRPETPVSDVWLSPIPFKVVSLLLHAGSAVMATWALSLITRSRWPAIAGGLLFSLHPLQVESVCWTTGMKDVLCGFLGISAIAFYARWLAEKRLSPWRSWRWYAALAAAVLAMLAKPTGMMVPVSLAAVDLALRRVPLVRRFPALTPFFVPAIACGAIILAVQNDPLVPEVPLWAQPLVACDTIAFYLYKIVLPFRLTEDYGRTPQVIWQNGQIWWTWVITAAALLLMLLSRNRYALLAAALFVAPLIPVSGITRFDMQQYSTASDHYIYQSLLGFGLLLAIALRPLRTEMSGAWMSGAWIDGGAIAVLIVLATCSWRYARLWTNPWNLYQDMQRQNPRSWLARTILAEMTDQAGDIAYAMAMNNEALHLNPDYATAYRGRAKTFMRLGRAREAADDLLSALKTGRGNVDVAQKLVECGKNLCDLKLQYEGARCWLRFDPGNTSALETISRIRAEQVARLAATKPSTKSSTEAEHFDAP